MNDVVVSDIWDEYRERHPPSRNFSANPHYKSLASEIDMDAPLPSTQIETLENGIQQQTTADPDVAAAQPPNVVKHLMQNLRTVSQECGGLEELRSIRCLFVLRIETDCLDVNEFFVDVERRAANDTVQERLELAGTPVLAYGWGTRLWLGDTKPLQSRAWFGGP